MAQMKAQGSLTIIDTNDIESIVVEYARNQSTSSPPTSGWSTNRPTWAQGYYIWQRTRIHKTGTSDSEDTFGTAVCITGSTGSTGTSITISSIKYATSTTESQPADSSFTYTSVPTVAEGSWLWTKTEYSDGSKIYTKSKQGKSGSSITVTKTEYQSGTSPTTAPTGTWSTSIPTVAEGNYLWTKTTYSDGNYSYTVAKQGESGTSVTISSTSVQYQVGSSATTAPTGTWQNSVQATTTGQYLWTRTVVTYSDSSSTTSYSVAAHGSTGTSVSVSSIKYAVTTTESQPSDSSFSTTFPSTVAEGSWLWTLTTYSNGSKMYTKSKQGKSGNDGRSLTATETKYTNVASGTTQTQVEALAESVWVSNVPSYDTSKPDYWVRVKNTYDKAPTTVYIYYKDNATSESLYNSAMAQSIAQSANENANGAMSQAAANIQTITRLWYAKANSMAPAAPTTHVIISSATTYNDWNIKRPNANDSYPYYFYCDETCTGGGVYSWSEVTLDTSNLSQYQIGALTAKVKNFWWDSSGAHVASGKNGNEVTQGTVSTYGYHALMGLAGINFNYDGAKVIDLNSTTPSLDFYQPPTINDSTVTQGKKTMMLSANALRFYNPTDGTTEQAVLDSNGLLLKEGGIKSGSVNAGNSGFIYLSTKNYGSNLTINGHQASNWREVIGTKFGVDADGNLYASNATINGKIVVGSGSTISANTTINGIAASTITTNVTKALQQSVEYITGTQSSSTNAWTGVTTDSSLVAGKTIAYKLPYAGTSSAATLNLTLSGGGTTGAKALRRNDSSVTTQFPVNSVINMTYDGTYWRITGMGSDNNNYDRTAYRASVTAAAAIPATCIGVFNTSGQLVQLSSSSAFDITRPILYIGTAYTSNALTQTNNYTFWGTPFNLTTTHAITGAAAGKPVYIVGNLSGTVFSPTDTVLTCTEPIEADNLIYIRLGLMSTTTQAVLEADHPLYAYGERGFTIIQGEKGATGEQGDTGPAGPESIVIVSLNSFNWTASPATATLGVKLLVNGESMSIASYNWTKNDEDTSLTSNSTITINESDFANVYNCTVTWESGGVTNTQTGNIDLKALMQIYNEASKHANNYLSSDNLGIMIYDGTNNTVQYPSSPNVNTKNVFIDSGGIYIRNGLLPLATFSSDGVVLYHDNEPIATYGTNSIILGKESGTHIQLSTENGLEFFEANKSDAVAYMNNETLFITQAKLLNLLRIDQFIWKIRGEGRISLRYEPER